MAPNMQVGLQEVSPLEGKNGMLKDQLADDDE